MTISDTAPISKSLSNPKSIMRKRTVRSGLVLGLDVDRVGVGRLMAGDLLRWRHGSVGRLVGALYAVLEALDCGAEIGADVLELLGTEDQHHDQQHDQPVPDA